MTITPYDRQGLPAVPKQAPLGCRYLDRMHGRLVERGSRQEVTLEDVRAMLQAGDRLRVVSWPSGTDCTVDVLMELIAPLLDRVGGVSGLLGR